MLAERESDCLGDVQYVRDQRSRLIHSCHVVLVTNEPNCFTFTFPFPFIFTLPSHPM